ncbi:translocon-associated protein subunit beta-like [Harmonia axyridis]|uniref:translocon-associated protein subunit beta-like n=1 Tax=Harmonia axyridis TaxID=115357 RepID=UPI001E278EBC|nr:translocon-associated protein subunit beta-like [Harmonia axyridis]
MIKSTIYLIFVLLAAVCGEREEESGPKLLVSKQILNKYLVETKDIELKYSIYNIGNAAAVAVTLTDNAFHPDVFDVAGGHLFAEFSRIPPQSNVSHVVVVRPKSYGYFNFTSAEVRYKSSEDASTVQISHSSEPGEGGIIAFRDYDNNFSSHCWDWLAFALMTTPSLVIPLALWYSSKSKYEKLAKTNKKQH